MPGPRQKSIYDMGWGELMCVAWGDDPSWAKISPAGRGIYDQIAVQFMQMLCDRGVMQQAVLEKIMESQA